MDSDTKRMYKLGQGTYKVTLSFPNIGQSGVIYETNALEYDKFSLTEALMNGDSLEFVGCISNILQVQIHGANANLEGEKVIASIDIDGEDDPLDIFVGYVKNSKTRSDLAYKEIVCYDSLWKKVADKDVSKWYNAARFPMTMKQLRDSFFAYVGIGQETAELCNDNIVISKEYVQVERMNALDVAKSICQFNAVCGIMGRDDKFKYVMPESIDSSSDEENFFYKTMRYEEYVTNKIDKVEVRDDEDAEAFSYGTGTNKYIIQGNMFIFGLTPSVKREICSNIYAQIKNFQYRPVSYEAPGLPFSEVGTTQTFQVLDWLDGQGTRVSRSFPMLSRTLEGIQELTNKVDIQGKRNQTEFITDIRAQLDALQRTTQELKNASTKIVDYILPADIEESNIASGSNSTIETFSFFNSSEGEKSSFYSMVDFTIETDVINDAYGDCTLTAVIRLDGIVLDTVITTYGDGKYSLLLNCLLRDLTHGNHTLTINFALSGGSLSQMNIVSAYLLAASIVEDGNYSEDYEVDIDDDFAEYMELGGDDIIGDYIELEAPTGGSGNGQNFSGDQFCEDWLSAFVRPIEYAQIYDTKAGISPTYPSTDDPSDWANYMTSALMVGVKKLVPKFFDDQVYAQTGKHINVWFAGLQLDHPLNPNNRLMFGLWGVYMPNNVMFQIRENHPIQGYAVFDTGYKQGNIYYPVTVSSYNYLLVQYLNGEFTENTGSNYLRQFILVYNVEAFKTYLNGLSAASIESLLQRSFFILANCNVKKEKVQGQTDWSDNDDYHGE